MFVFAFPPHSELPLVESTRRLLLPHVGQMLGVVSLEPDTKVMPEGEDALRNALTGKLVNVHRRGKWMWLQMENGPCVAVHLGMTGKIVVREATGARKGGRRLASSRIRSVQGEDETTSDGEVEWPPRFTKAVWSVGTDGTQVAFLNARRFGKLRVFTDPLAPPSPIALLGPDAYTDLPDAPAFRTLLSSHGRAVKGVLLDQAVLAGIGNWIADEVLYSAGVHPARRADELTDDEADAVHAAIEMVIRTAVDADSVSARFPPDWIFHRRWSKGSKSSPAKTAGQPSVTFVTVAGRTSAIDVKRQPKTGKRKR